MIAYYYCPDYDTYVKLDDGMPYRIRDGEEQFTPLYFDIWIGDIYTEDITKEEYYAALDKSIADHAKSTQRPKR